MAGLVCKICASYASGVGASALQSLPARIRQSTIQFVSVAGGYPGQADGCLRRTTGAAAVSACHARNLSFIHVWLCPYGGGCFIASIYGGLGCFTSTMSYSSSVMRTARVVW